MKMLCLSIVVLELIIGTAYGFPATGFIKYYVNENEKQAEVSKSGETTGPLTAVSGYAKIVKKINSPIKCDSLEFINLPKPNYSPFSGGNKFDIITDLVNGKLAWSNEREYLTYVAPTSDSEGGTWIVGIEPGVDNGYIFLKPDVGDSHGMTPISMKSEKAEWHWLQKGKWEVQTNLEINCLDEVDSPSATTATTPGGLYSVEYLDSENHIGETHIIVNPTMGQLPYMKSIGKLTFSEDSLNSVAASIFKGGHWLNIAKIETIADYGAPVVIQNEGETVVGHIINDEHGWEGTWRISLKVSSHIPSVSKAMVIIELHGNDGFKTSKSFRALNTAKPSDLETRYMNFMLTSINHVKAGEHLWLFFSDPSKLVVEIDQLLLECVKVNDNVAVFEYTLSDRRDMMLHPMLKLDTDYVVMQKK